MKRCIILTAIGLALAVSCALCQETPPPPKPAPIDTSSIPAPSVLGILRQISLPAYPMLETRLKLTDEQKPKVKDLLTRADQSEKPRVAAQRKAAKAFADAVVSGASEQDLLKLAQTSIKADADVLEGRIKTLTALRTLLTMDQQKELTSMLEKLTSPWRAPAAP